MFASTACSAIPQRETLIVAPIIPPSLTDCDEDTPVAPVDAQSQRDSAVFDVKLAQAFVHCRDDNTAIEEILTEFNDRYVNKGNGS
jgi:hypothetical protein